MKDFREKYDRLDALVNNAATLSGELKRTKETNHELTWRAIQLQFPSVLSLFLLRFCPFSSLQTTFVSRFELIVARVWLAGRRTTPGRTC